MLMVKATSDILYVFATTNWYCDTCGVDGTCGFGEPCFCPCSRCQGKSPRLSLLILEFDQSFQIWMNYVRTAEKWVSNHFLNERKKTWHREMEQDNFSRPRSVMSICSSLVHSFVILCPLILVQMPHSVLLQPPSFPHVLPKLITTIKKTSNNTPYLSPSTDLYDLNGWKSSKMYICT